MGDLRIVEVRAHYIRLDADDDGELEIWRIVTDAEETVLLDKEEVYQIPFAALTPYIVPHRFYGESVADKLIEVQRIKTVLLRMFLDSWLLRAEPAHAVDMSEGPTSSPSPTCCATSRACRCGAMARTGPWSRSRPARSTSTPWRHGIRPHHGGKPLGHRQERPGLNPDTLHDTAKGALALITAAQKRVRLIARIFAETGIKRPVPRRPP
jgi:hypothetical protein